MPQVDSSTPVENPYGPARLPAEKRHSLIAYQNEDGTEGGVAFPINYEELYNLKGRLLTLIDATFTDPEQRKAQKDVVWQAVRQWMDDIERTCGYDVDLRIPEARPER